MNETDTLRPQFDGVQRWSLAVGAAGLALCLLGAFSNPGQFFHSYLLAYIFWMGIALGSVAIVMLHHLVGGSWGFIIQRTLESGSRTLPLMLALFLPLLLFGLPYLYEWARPEAVAHDELLQHKAQYLNVVGFAVRAAIYFAVWIGLAYLLNRWSLEQDRTADAGLTRRLQIVSAPGLLLYALTVTFASIDWVMSLEPRWSSTIYGPVFMVGQVLAALAFVIAVVSRLAAHRPLAEVARPSHFHDLGSLLFAFVMLWAYVSFSQFLIIWSGNLPEESPWYVRRMNGGWQWIGLMVVVFHFFVPFFLLLSRFTKRSIPMLSALATGIILMRLVDLFWVVTPVFHPDGFGLHWMDLVAPIGVGGIWMWMFVRQLKGRPLLPLHDPRLARALEPARGH